MRLFMRNRRLMVSARCSKAVDRADSIGNSSRPESERNHPSRHGRCDSDSPVEFHKIPPSFGGDAAEARSLNRGRETSKEARVDFTSPSMDLAHGTARAWIKQTLRQTPPMPIASVAEHDSTAGYVSIMATLTIRNLDDAMEQ